MDISGNDLEFDIEDLESDDIESDDIESDVIESDISGNVDFYPNITFDDDYLEYVRETTTTMENTSYYSNYFENLQTIGIFIVALLVAHGLIIAFCMGFKK